MFDLGVLIWLVGAGMAGFAIVSLGIGSPWKRNRDQWLLHHFGEEGRKRWFLNKELVGQWCACTRAGMHWVHYGRSKLYGSAYVAYQKAQTVMERSKELYGADCFNKAYRAADGSCRGMMVDRAEWFYTEHPELGRNTRSQPWGTSSWYCREHSASTEHKNKNCGWRGPHGEPRGVDWLAAGFWDKVRRDDGLVVDPINVLYNDWVNYWLEYGTPDNDVACCDATFAWAEKAARKIALGGKFSYEHNG